ncbi:hypothetical protein EX895_006398 [Sporisorium graminicola]|uniref:G-protein coupled receptors family 1 profile domain-containing protein n=1 Tax=Sporisorium graminicola TaxID=280036 RepID=A0A4U7KLD8_9BASI|nr:hypothetical protein EX895_006398 [Sporisorium graminicola]TKY84497.1 hypothetical protein EX895_006398 [Sporisorium graminicola]
MSAGPLQQVHPWWLHADDPSVRVITANNNNTNETETFHRESVGTVGNNIDMAICCVSFIGAIAIILPYVLNRRSRKLRHALILGLATSDLATSVVIIITTACLIANINLVSHDAPCTFLGYILISSIFSQHLWNLSIAVITYMILVYPLSSFTLTVERRVRWLWPVFWLASFVVNAIAFGLGGYGFRGGYCALTTGFYFASIFQFIPRAIVFVVILCLYTHLFFFLRRTNLFSKANNSNSLSQSHRRSQAQHLGTQSKQQQQHQQYDGAEDASQQSALNEQPQSVNMSFADALATPTDDASAMVKGYSGPPSSAAGGVHSRKTSTGSRVTPHVLNKNDARPFEYRRSSSLVEKDGSIEMATLASSLSRRKGSDGTADPALSALLAYNMNQLHSNQAGAEAEEASVAAPLATYGLLDPYYSMAPPRAVPGQLDIHKANAPHDDASSISRHSPSDSSYAGGEGAPTLSAQESTAPLNDSFARGEGESLNIRKINAASSKRPVTAEAAAATAASTSQLGGNGVEQRRASAGDPRYDSHGAAATASGSDSDESDDSEIQHMRPRKDAGDFEMITPPVEHLKHSRAPLAIRNFTRMADVLAMGEDEMVRARHGGGGRFAGERPGSAVQILPGEVMVEMPSNEAFEESLGNDWKWGMNVTAGGTAGTGKHSKHARNCGRDDSGVATGTSSTSSADENGVEAIGSTLNRQASLLLLLYPLAYCLLFSISIARLAVDLADPGGAVRNSHDWLHQLSRWLIFAQGAIDAVIFQFIERQFRHRMKRRRRKAMGENVADSFTHRVGKRAVQGLKRSWPHTRSRTGASAAAAATGDDAVLSETPKER